MELLFFFFLRVNVFFFFGIEYVSYPFSNDIFFFSLFSPHPFFFIYFLHFMLIPRKLTPEVKKKKYLVQNFKWSQDFGFFFFFFYFLSSSSWSGNMQALAPLLSFFFIPSYLIFTFIFSPEPSLPPSVSETKNSSDKKMYRIGLLFVIG